VNEESLPVHDDYGDGSSAHDASKGGCQATAGMSLVLDNVSDPLVQIRLEVFTGEDGGCQCRDVNAAKAREVRYVRYVLHAPS
jgi:hypothetical protein